MIKSMAAIEDAKHDLFLSLPMKATFTTLDKIYEYIAINLITYIDGELMELPMILLKCQKSNMFFHTRNPIAIDLIEIS